MANNNFKATIDVINNGKKYPAISLVRSHPEVAAAISKLVASREKPLYDRNGNRDIEQTNRSEFENISKDIAKKTQDSESIMQLFPDMELTAQILISSIISPKDMSNGDILYTAPQGFLPPDVTASLIDKIRRHFDHDYKIKSLVPVILREILFESGSYPIAIIPENSIDDMINGTSRLTMEGISSDFDNSGMVRSTGILGDPTTSKNNIPTGFFNIAKESFSNYSFDTSVYNPKLAMEKDNTFTRSETNPIGKNVFVVDNINVLKIPKIKNKLASDRVNKIIRDKVIGSNRLMYANESMKEKLTDAQMQALLYKSKQRDFKNTVKVPTKDQASRKTIGAPLIMNLPPESVMPVHAPGDEKNHIGYFVLVDIEGNPVNRNSNKNHFNELQSRLNDNSDMTSFLTKKSADGLGGTQNNGKINVEAATRIYTSIVEADLVERLRTGVYGRTLSLAKNEEVYRIMLARDLANQGTQLLYIPAELMTYFAYKYDANGVGKSLMEGMRVLNSLRAAMMFARVLASTKNSIGTTNVKMKLDELDPDPMKTIEESIHEISKTRQQYLPLGINTPYDLMDWVQKSGFRYSFEGHPKIPDVGFEFTESATNYVQPDQALDDELKKRAIQGFGLSPEMVDNGFASEFATTVVSNNLLLAKNVSQIQQKFSPLLTDHARKKIINDGNIYGEIRQTILESYDKFEDTIKNDPDLKDADQESVVNFLTDWFINNFELGLPQPDSITLENQMKAFDAYAEGLDKALDSWINTNILNSDMSGEISGEVENAKVIIKSQYLRKYMAENNIFNELSELTSVNEKGEPLLDFAKINADHIASLVKSLTTLYSKTHAMKVASDTDIAKLSGGDGIEATSSETPSSSGGSDDGFGGDDDFSFDMPGDDAQDPLEKEIEDPTKGEDKLLDLDKI